MENETELQEYAASVAAGTSELIAVIDALKDALVAVLPNEEDCAVAIASAKEARDAMIRDTYRIGLIPFMQPAAEESDEGECEEEGAGSGNEEGARGRR